MDFDEMLRVDELINFWARSGS